MGYFIYKYQDSKLTKYLVGPGLANSSIEYEVLSLISKMDSVILRPYHEVLYACRLCRHIVVVVGLVCVNDPIRYAVELLMPDRSKVRHQTKRDKGVFAAHRRSRFASETRMLIECACASEPETA